MGQTAPAVACGAFKKWVSKVLLACMAPVWRTVGASPGSEPLGEMGVR